MSTRHWQWLKKKENNNNNILHHLVDIFLFVDDWVCLRGIILNSSARVHCQLELIRARVVFVYHYTKKPQHNNNCYALVTSNIEHWTNFNLNEFREKKYTHTHTENRNNALIIWKLCCICTTYACYRCN